MYGDGQARINLELARWALSTGIRVTLVSVVVDPELLRAGAIWEKVQVRKRPVLVRVATFVGQANRIIDRLRAQEKIDFVIANGYTLTRPHDLNLCQFVHAAWLNSTVHGIGTRGAINRLYQAIYTRYNAFHERRSYRAARVVVAPSNHTLQELKQQLSIDERKLQVIPNGVDCQEFSPAKADRKSLGLPENVPLALFVGDVRTNRKGMGSILRAMVKLPGVHLAVVGMLNRSPFPAMAHELGIAERIHFLDFRRDVPQIMRASDVFVFPSWYEPFGLVVTEALSCGLPVVTTACCGAGELLTKECGSVVQDPDDAASLASAIAHWIENPALRAEAAPACRAVALANGWASMAKRYFDVLRETRPLSIGEKIFNKQAQQPTYQTI
jgi:glycosyltransferase involved in cell wall biosynthesis